MLTEKVNLHHRKYYDAEEKLLNEQEKCKKNRCCKMVLQRHDVYGKVSFCNYAEESTQ